MAQYMRAQVLLEPTQHRALAQIAQEEGRSISEVLRELVDRGLRQRIYAEMAQAAQELVEDYSPGGDLTAMVALDAEDFFDA